MPEYTVYAKWEVSAIYYIEAETEAEAKKVATKKWETENEPENTEFIPDTLTVDDVEEV
jgi:hypothetical protein